MGRERVVHLDMGSRWRGGQQQVFLLHRELQRRGWTTLVLTPASSALARRCQENRLPRREILGNRVHWPAWVWAVWRETRGHAILHAHDAHAAGIAAVVRRLRPSVRFVCHRRVSYRFAQSALSRWKYAQVDGWVAVSEEIGALLREGGRARGPVAIAHSALDQERVARALGRRHREDFLREFDIDPDALVVGCCGALSPQKGHRVLLDAAPRVISGYPHVVFLLVGEGELRAELEAQITTQGLARHFRLAGFREDALELTGFWDVAVVPSVAGEGSSAAVKEAMAMGVPSVVTDLPGNLEVAGDACLSVPRADPVQLASALCRLLGSPAFRAERGAAGRGRASGFTVEAMGDAVLDLYRIVLERQP